MVTILFSLLSVMVTMTTAQFDYCTITKKHTMCQYKVSSIFFEQLIKILLSVRFVNVTWRRGWNFVTALLKDIIISFKGFGAKCNQVLGSGTTQQEIKEILRVHNELRAKLANGLEKRGKPGPQPPAADMEEMVRIMNDCRCWLFSTLVRLF